MEPESRLEGESQAHYGAAHRSGGVDENEGLRARKWYQAASAASVGALVVLGATMIISPRTIAIEKGRFGSGVLKEIETQPYRLVTSETNVLLAKDPTTAEQLEAKKLNLPPSMAGMSSELSSDLVALKKLAGSTETVKEKGQDVKAAEMRKKFGKSQASEIIASARHVYQRAAEIAGSKVLGLAKSPNSQHDVQLKQVHSSPIVHPKPKVHKPFAADRKWSLAKERQDMDSFFDHLDNHAAVKEMAARKVHSHVAALQADHQEHEGVEKMQLAESQSHSGSSERDLENKYYNRILHKDEAAREAAHKNDRIPHHDMSDEEARKDALSYFGQLEKKAENEHKMIESEEHNHTPKVYRHMSAKQAQADEKHFYSHETKQAKSEMAQLHLGGDTDQKAVHMSAKQLRQDVSNYYDSEVKQVMAAHATPAHLVQHANDKAATATKAAAEKRLAHKFQASQISSKIGKSSSSPSAAKHDLSSSPSSHMSLGSRPSVLNALHRGAEPAKLLDPSNAPTVQLKQWRSGGV